MGGGGGPRIPALQPAGPQPLASPRRCTIARCQMPASHPPRAKRDARGPSRAHPRKRPSPRGYPPRQPILARLPTWRLAVSAAAAPPPLLLRGCYIARSAMFPVSAGARRATTTGWVGARGAGARGRGWEAEPRLSTLHPSLPQLLSMPSCPASPLGGLSTSARSCSGFSRQPAGGRQ